MTGFFQGRKAAEFLNATEEMSGVSLNDPGDGFFRSLSNRKQVLLFVIATLVLTVVTVWAARVWFRHTSTLTFAVASEAGVEAKFAAKLASVLQANNSSLRLKIEKNSDSDKALAAFDRKQADLAILRTDQKVPGRARAIAILDKDLVLLSEPERQEAHQPRSAERQEDRDPRQRRSQRGLHPSRAVVLRHRQSAHLAADRSSRLGDRQAARAERLCRGDRHRERSADRQGTHLRAHGQEPGRLYAERHP